MFTSVLSTSKAHDDEAMLLITQLRNWQALVYIHSVLAHEYDVFDFLIVIRLLRIVNTIVLG